MSEKKFRSTKRKKKQEATLVGDLFKILFAVSMLVVAILIAFFVFKNVDGFSLPDLRVTISETSEPVTVTVAPTESVTETSKISVTVSKTEEIKKDNEEVEKNIESAEASVEEAPVAESSVEETPVEETPAAEIKYYTFSVSTKSTALNLRTEPSLYAGIIGKLPQKTTGYVLRPGSEWSYIRTEDGAIGYSYNDYLVITKVSEEDFPEDIRGSVEAPTEDLPSDIFGE